MERTYNFLSRWIAALYRLRKGYVNKKVDHLGLGGGKFMFLMTLYRHNGLSQEKITQFLNIDKTSTAKALKKLEAQGFVTRKKDDVDKRAYKVFLTPKAFDAVPAIQDAINSWENAVTADITESELIMVEGILHKMAQSAFDINNSVKE